MSAPISIAAGCFAPRWHPDWDALRAEILDRVADAACQLVVFPEYAAMAAALIGTPKGEPDPMIWAERGAAAHAAWVALMQEAAQTHGCHILAGSGPVRVGGRTLNRAVLVAPDGSTGHQDKLIPTPWERRDMAIAGGTGLTLFDTALGKIGICICYDAEFPLFARALAAAGAGIILVPSCTDTPAGQMRVQIAARARALENQCLVVQAPMLGAVPGCDPIHESYGRAGIFGPPDRGQPDDGILALAHPDTLGWMRHTLDPAKILATRTRGDVTTFADWPLQPAPDLSVETVTLGK
ncbi:MAG: putative amidohydrolase [Rhodobacteraceae bacterium HLUCCA08]|nr:MAG: putative amidohydrolase [Rhodobacteraceae bacterium HLUCCA08]